MFTSNFVKNYDDLFIDTKNRNNISVIFLGNEFVISTCLDGTYIKKQFSVIVEKFGSQELLQVRICDLTDKTKMYIKTIDGGMFEQMKQDQSLHVTFVGFVENLISILSHSAKGELLIRLLKEKENYNLQFCEVRSFKNLIHLCLPLEEAPTSVVFYHINESLNNLQKQQSVQERTLRHMETQLSEKEHVISQLRKDIANFNAKLEDERRLLHSHESQEIQQLHKTIKSLSETKEHEEKCYKEAIANLRNQVDRLNGEINNLKEQNAHESKKYGALKDDLATFKSKISSLKEQNEKLVGEIASMRNLDRKNEIHNSELRKKVQELREIVEKLQKLNSEYEAELEAEKKICHTKRNALQMATDDIAKANDIILKQSKQIAELRKTIDWRTEVALRQEVTVRDKEKELAAQTERIIALQKELKMKEEDSKKFYSQIQSMDQLATKIETKYSTKISDLTEKISILLKDRSDKRFYK